MWKYLVNSTQAVSFVFDPGSVTADGSVVVVKRSTDPVRINNSSFSVETAGIAAGAYRLVSDKTKFHLNNMTSLAASLPSGSSGNFEIYGNTRGPEPFGNDPTFAEFQDRDPRPNGKVFDIDTPGFPLNYVNRYSLGTLIAVRYNFLQYANFSGRRCSDDFAWHSKTTIRREESAGIPCFNFFTRPSFPDDNSCGSGHSTTAP